MVLDSRKWDARYGWDVLATHGPRFRSYIAITSPSAWAAVLGFLPEPPRHLELQQGMAEGYLDALLQRLPDAEWLLAIGGGNALDVGKYVAWKLGRPLVMIPTIVSTGSVFQSPVVVRRPGAWDRIPETVAPEYLLLDFGVIRAAPPHLNRAGMGECVCQLAHIGAANWWAAQGLEQPPFDAAAAEATIAWVRARVAGFSADLNADGRPGEAGIRIGAEINRERYDLPTRTSADSHSIDHAFPIAFERVHGRELIHGEGVALGSLINAFVYEWGFEETKSLLDSCAIRYRPRELGCTDAEFRGTLDRINEIPDEQGWPQTWFHHRRLDRPALRRMLAAIDA